MSRVAGWALLAMLGALFVLRVVQVVRSQHGAVATASGAPAPDFEAHAARSARSARGARSRASERSVVRSRAVMRSHSCFESSIVNDETSK